MIDAWSGPTPTPQQFPANEPNGIRKLLDKIKALELQVKEATSNLLGTAGIRLTQLGMTIDSSLTIGGSETVDGPLVVHGTADFDGATTIGGTLGVTGDATFSGDTSIGGNAAITGTLSLPAGIIDNAALASPVVPGYVDIASTVTFTAGGSYYDGTQIDITVPAGISRLLVNAQSGIYCEGNSNTTGGMDGAGADGIYCRTIIGGVTGQGFATVVLGSGSAGSVFSSRAYTLTGLTPGSTISFATQTKSAFQNIPANAGNKATLSAMLVWLR